MQAKEVIYVIIIILSILMIVLILVDMFIEWWVRRSLPQVKRIDLTYTRRILLFYWMLRKKVSGSTPVDEILSNFGRYSLTRDHQESNRDIDKNGDVTKKSDKSEDKKNITQLVEVKKGKKK